MSELPTGTVTFLFTDIEGSSRLWEQYPEAMKIALARHDVILRRAVESNCGHIVKTTGDGLHAVFATAADGICAALSAQQALQAEAWEVIRPQSIRARMGLHTGEAETRAGDYFGPALNRAARLMAVGSGGQTLVSNATAELLHGGMPAETTLLDLGEHRLKDLARPERVFQLVHSSLPSEFPPLKSIDRVPNNLPAPLTSFIGREKEVAVITQLLKTTRLITLTGPGGTGKTRLAQEVSAQQLTSFPHGAWLIELAPLIDPSQIIPLTAQVLGLQENPAVPLSTMIVNYLHDKEALLILDNCEHLIDACAHLADDLLHRCPRIKIIASSREALGIAGEVAYRIPSLQESEAAQLFVERACAANPSFKKTESNAAAVARICNRLDGIPLAIELAAARSRMLSPEQIAARLDDRFHLLVGGSRTALPRQQTLRAMIDWSYDLLSEEEKTLLRTCSVFSSGWTLEALEAVAQDPNAIVHLEQLVNKSLVVAEERENEMGPSEMRYSLLETIRQYTREKLLDSGVDEAVQLRDRHLDFFKKLSEVAEERLVGIDMVEWIDRLSMEEDNLRTALEWAAERDPLAALQMAASLIYFWSRRASASEGYHLIQSVMAQAEERLGSEQKTMPDYRAARAKALVSAAGLAFGLGINQTALDMAKSAVSLAREVNAAKTLLAALNFAALSSAFVGNFPLAQACVAEALVLGPQHEYADEQALTYGLTIFLKFVKNEPFPPEALEEALRLARASGNRVVQGITLTNIGRFYSATGHFTEAQAYFEEAETLYKEARDRMMYLTVRSETGHLLRKQGRHAEAIAVYRETIQAFRETSQLPAVAHELECFAFLALGQIQLERAAILLAAAGALREQLGSEMILPERHEYAEMLSLLRDQMDAVALAKAWSEGRAMTVDQAIQFALG